MDIYYNKGIFIEIDENKILVDPDKDCNESGVDYVFVTHPHSDHYGGIWNFPTPQKIMNNLTYEVITFRNRQRQLQNTKFIGNALEFNGFRVLTHPSGHTIKSIQFEFIFNNGTRVVCTGDFCLQPRIAIDRCEIVQQPDVLIIDCTYGSKVYRFPNRNEIYKNLIKWIKTTRSKGVCPIISTRIIGTAQEITKLINVAEGNLRVYVHSTIFHINGIFKKYSDIGVAKKRIFEEVVGHRDAVFINPFWGDINDVNENTALCSGWLLNDDRDRAFPLSNHGGYNQIIEYIRMSNPKKVLTVYGNADVMARDLRELGYDASAI